ncbi:Uncharacterised protein [Porphyromonas macacae]|uniref:Uncharacterized protein n=1 Tax=Porphyromonas macacae TaxID=28115 RepID=A0A379E8N6_9PORP|nr:Uncharacterised protein [Porphyromonas macacae]
MLMTFSNKKRRGNFPRLFCLIMTCNIKIPEGYSAFNVTRLNALTDRDLLFSFK